MPYKGVEMLVLWDFNNQPSWYTRPKNLRKAILRRYPGIKLTFKAYANKMTAAQLRDCMDVGADVIRVPSKDGEADRKITLDLFDFVFDHAAPGFVMLISEDADFAFPLSCIDEMKYETVLVCRSKYAAKELKDNANTVLDWTSIARYGCKDMPDLPKSVTGRDQNTSPQIGVFWNIEKLRVPSDVEHKDAIKIITEKLVKPNIKDIKEVKPKFHVYGGYSFIPSAFGVRVKGVEYAVTSTDPKGKLWHAESIVQSWLMEFACYNPTYSNIFIIDDNVNLTGTILWLTNKSFNVVLVGVANQQGSARDLERLRDAATLCLDTPSEDFFTPI